MAIERETTAEVSIFGDSAMLLMHTRLVEYGLCWLRGGASDTEITRREIVRVEPMDADEDPDRPDPKKLRIIPSRYGDPDLDKQRRQWTRIEIEAAARLHSRIIRLPLLAHALTIQVFYGEACAEDWAERLPDEKYAILRDLTYWPTRPYGVNKRLERAGDRMRITPRDFIPVMLRGMRILLNSERLLVPLAQQSASIHPPGA